MNYDTHLSRFIDNILWTDLDFQGRKSGKDLFIFSLFLIAFILGVVAWAMLITIGYSYLFNARFGMGFALVVLALAIVLSLPANLSFTITRLHDLGLSGWWILGIFGVNFLAEHLGSIWQVIAIIISIFFLVMPGKPIANKFGEPPIEMPISDAGNEYFQERYRLRLIIFFTPLGLVFALYLLSVLF